MLCFKFDVKKKWKGGKRGWEREKGIGVYEGF